MLAAGMLLAGCGRAGFDRVADGAATDALAQCIVDDFGTATLDAGTWESYVNAPTSLSVSGGELVVFLGTTAAPAFAGILSSFGDFTGSTIEVELTEAPTAGPGIEAAFVWRLDSNNFYVISVDAGQLGWNEVVAGVAVAPGGIPFDAVMHRHWRMQHDPAANRVRFSTSSDGTTWALQQDSTAQLSPSHLRVELQAGTYVSAAAPGRARFDNVVARGCTL